MQSENFGVVPWCGQGGNNPCLSDGINWGFGWFGLGFFF